HFDVGPKYHQIGPAYASTDADPYLIPASLARGGESLKEVACVPSATLSCQFPDYPGTVSWKIGFQLVRDAIVGPPGEQVTQAELDASAQKHPKSQSENDVKGFHCDAWGNDDDPGVPDNEDCRRRFDRDRNGFFHYMLYAHARGMPKSTDKASPDFHVPRSTSGVSDLPGGNGMVTLGLWDNFIGTDFAVAATTMHELGHQLELWHGG